MDIGLQGICFNVIPIQALESLRKGVVFSNIYDAIRKDKLVVFRPNLSKKDKAAAIAKAFQYVGVPYDYRFDLETEDKNKIRQVDHRTINWLICKNIKYSVK